jgi:predicted transcriptional regulator
MGAKQTRKRVMLSVRIPAELREKLAQAARIRGSSASNEVARLIDQQLHADIPVHLQSELSAMKARAYKNQVECLEALILKMADPTTAENAAARLDSLSRGVKDLRAQRARLQKQMEADVQSRMATLTAVQPARVGNPFHALDSSVVAKDTQLKPAMRRWAHLKSALAGRPKGIKKRLAQELGWAPAQISQLLSSPSNPNHRNITSATARKLELALGLETGALDKIERELNVTEMMEAVLNLEATLTCLDK